MANSGFSLRSVFDHHLNTFLAMVQCKRKVNTSRQVTAAELVDLHRATELFREVVPLLRAELEELRVELLGPEAAAKTQAETNPFLETPNGTDGTPKKKKKVVTFVEEQQTNPSHVHQSEERREVVAKPFGKAGVPSNTPVLKPVLKKSAEVQQSEVPPKTELQPSVFNSATTDPVPVGSKQLAVNETSNSTKKPAPIDWSQIKTRKFRTPLPPCYFCGEKHPLYKCAEFKRMQFAERLAYVQRKRLCLNCFSQQHHVSKCKDIPRCLLCTAMHQTILHRIA